MLAIYKKELKAYFHSMIGYVFIAFFLLVVGIYMYAINFVGQAANLEYVLSNMTFIFIILIPILTMRVIAEEKKQKTDQLLFTSSVSMPKIVIAKYLAVLSLFIITMLVVCLYPLVLSIFGEVPFGTAYSGIFGFVLMGAALIAIGVFISSLTESQVIAAVISFIVMLLCYLTDTLSRYLPTAKLPTMMITLVVFAVFCYIIYVSLRKIYVAVGTWVLGTVALILLYFFHATFYDGLLAKMASAIAIMKPFDNFSYGTIYLSDVIYYLSIIALFITLTTLFIKEGLSDKLRRGSAFRTSLMILSVIICVVVNLFVGELKLSTDFSTNKLFSITKDTKEFVEGLENNITIYYVYTDERIDPPVEKVLDKYRNLNSKVKVEKKDQVLYPNFTKKYSDTDLADNSIIVVNNDTEAFRVINYADMFQIDSAAQQVTGIDVEGQITSALDYVTNEKLPVLYYTSGHGEEDMGDALKNLITKKNFSVNTLATLTVDKIPEDCDVLVINGATSDFSDSEIAMIRLYLENGGDAIITLQYTNNKMANLKDLLNYYGIRQKDGVIMEDYGHYIDQYPYYVLPSYGSHEIVNGVASSRQYVVLPTCIGIVASDTVRESVTLTDLLTASEGAYSKTNPDSTTLDFEEGDIHGPFDLGILAEEKSEATDETMKLAVYSSAGFISNDVIASGQFANGELFADTLGYMSDISSNITIPVTSLTTSYLTIPAVLQTTLGIVFVFILPLGILVTGLVIWLGRRKA